MPSRREPCTYLAWDSDFFGIPIARVAGSRLTPALWREAEAWLREHGIACLYFLADAGHRPTIRLAEEMGFSLVDVRVDMLRRLSKPSPAANDRPDETISIRTAEDDDLAALEAIAARVHEDSRFFFDEGFPETRCRELYTLWIRKSCQGFADQVLTALVEGRPKGYISLHREPEAAGRIGLLGVASSHRARGVGRALVKEALSWCAREGMTQVSVATQARNLASQRLYQRCGFQIREVGLWYHKWFDTPTRGARP